MQAALDCAALRSCRGDAVGAGRTMAIVAMAARILPACSAPHLTAWQTFEAPVCGHSKAPIVDTAKPQLWTQQTERERISTTRRCGNGVGGSERSNEGQNDVEVIVRSGSQGGLRG